MKKKGLGLTEAIHRINKIRNNDIKNIGEVMTNYDHEIDRDIETKLKEGNCTASYPGWNFHGTVLYDGANFQCRITRYSVQVDVLESPTLEGIMKEACERWGND